MCNEQTAAAIDDASNAAQSAQSAQSAAPDWRVSIAPQWQAHGVELTQSEVVIDTPDGKMDACFVHPAKGSHPAVLLWPDIAGLREAKRIMAARLAAAGYAVLVLNHYYRDAPAPLYVEFSDWLADRDSAWPRVARIRPAGIAADTQAALAFLDGQAAVDHSKKIASIGYCLGAAFALRAAAAAPERIQAAVSFHGAFLITNLADSPHRLFAQMAPEVSLLLAIGEDDHVQQPEDQAILQQAAQDAGRAAQVTVFPAQHGWCVIDMPRYDAQQSELAWQQMLACFARGGVA